MATIRERGYHHWDGHLAERKHAWWPITRTGIVLAFRKKWFKFAFAAAFLPSAFCLALIYISERLEDFRFMVRGAEQPQVLNINPEWFKMALSNGMLLFLLIVVLIFAGAGLVADDLKHTSLQLYFSRPLKKGDYILGKLAVVFFFGLVLALVPGLLLFIFKLVFAGSFKFFLEYPWLPLAIIAYTGILTVFFAFYALLLSATSKNRTYVMVLIPGIYIFSNILFLILKGIFGSPYMALFSFPANLQQVAALVFAAKRPFAFSPWLSLFVVAGVCVASFVVLRRKTRSVEVIK